MAKCKDCLHYEACSAFSKIINAACDVEQGCEHFKDHSNYQEVVRCKDCKHWVTYFDCCEKKDITMHEDDFCSFGERREGA